MASLLADIALLKAQLLALQATSLLDHKLMEARLVLAKGKK